MKPLKSFFVFAGVALIVPTITQAQSLKVGDPAPPIKASKWIKGTPVKRFEKGKVYVVELWATWCGSCIEGIPDLTRLAKKFTGKVTFIGISIWRRDEKKDLKPIIDFVNKMGDKMDYSVCIDQPNLTTGLTWLKAAGLSSIPAAFIVNRDGVIAWVGPTYGDLEKNLEAILAGAFDLAKSKAELAAVVAEQHKNDIYQAVLDAHKMYRDGQRKKAIRWLDELAKDPVAPPHVNVMIINLMLADDFKSARTRIEAIEKTIKPETAQFLALIGGYIAENPKLALDKEAGEYALKLALKANEITKWQNLMALSMLARIYWDRKDARKAVEYQQKALDLYPTSEYKDKADARRQLETDLAKYKAALQ